MTLYLDTSSLVKLYVEEVGSQDVRDLVTEAAVVTTLVVAYPRCALRWPGFGEAAISVRRNSRW